MPSGEVMNFSFRVHQITCKCNSVQLLFSCIQSLLRKGILRGYVYELFLPNLDIMLIWFQVMHVLIGILKHRPLTITKLEGLAFLKLIFAQLVYPSSYFHFSSVVSSNAPAEDISYLLLSVFPPHAN